MIRFEHSVTLALSSCFLLLIACQDAPVAPTADEVANPTFAKGGKPGKPGGGDPPPPADPQLIYSTYVNKRVKGERLGWSIHVMNADGTNQIRVLTNNEERGIESLTPQFSPDGTRFVFHREVYGVGPHQWEIAIANLDGSGLTTVLASQSGLGNPRWSPVALGDGLHKIVYSDGYGLSLVNLDGSGNTLLTNTPTDWFYFESAQWSPAADRLLTVYWDQTANEYQVVLYGIACTPGCGITSTLEIDLTAWIDLSDSFMPRDWSNAGNRIVGAVHVGGAGYADLWVLDVTDPANPGFTQLTYTSGLDENHPTWSPDDSRIAYTGYPVNGDRSAFVMNADGTGSQVIAEVGNELGMDWRPAP